MQRVSGVAANQIITLVEPPDGDLDTVPDDADNCVAAANPDQRDTDADGIGNACDADIAVPNDCVVNFADLGVMQLAFLTSPDDGAWNPDADLNSDGLVNFGDLGLMKTAFFAAPGPSGVPNSCGGG